MDVVSIFSGAGGLDYGFQKAGYEILLACDNDKTVWSTYERNIKGRLFKDSVENLIPHLWKVRCDGLIGSPPCQSWSIAGSLRGENDERGKLFYRHIEALNEIRPKFFVAENVPGLLLERNKESFQTFIKLYEDCGYNVSVDILNTKDFGLAQDRERVFIIGFRKDFNQTFDFSPIKDRTFPKKTLRDAIGFLEDTAVPASDGNKSNPKTEANAHEYFVGSYSPMYLSRNRKREWDGVAFTVQASGRQCQLHPSSTMTRIDSEHFKIGKGSRRLTVRECACLQGFPLDFDFIYERVDDGYKMVGNSVAPVISEELAKAIKCQLSN